MDAFPTRDEYKVGLDAERKAEVSDWQEGVRRAVWVSVSHFGRRVALRRPSRSSSRAAEALCFLSQCPCTLTPHPSTLPAAWPAR